MKKVGLFAYGETGASAFKGLVDSYELVWVIIPPYNGLRVQDSSEVEKLAVEKGVKIVRINSAKDVCDLISKDLPDIVVISSYNKILPKEILGLTKFINIHHGDLPRWRGRANINWAILLGRKEIGLTFHEAIPNLDAGRIYARFMVSISDTDTVKNVYDKFNLIIEKEMENVIEKVLSGFQGEEQKGEATYCCTRIQEDGLIDWSKDSLTIDRLIRALTKPYSGAFTYFNNKKLIIWDAEIPKELKKYEGRIPGRVISVNKDLGVEVLTGDSSLTIKDVNYEGEDLDISRLVRSTKDTLGINFVQLLEDMQHQKDQR